MRVLTQNRAPHLMVTNYSPIAQLVERLTVNQNVRGSSPRRGAKYLKGLTCLSALFLMASFRIVIRQIGHRVHDAGPHYQFDIAKILNVC